MDLTESYTETNTLVKCSRSIFIHLQFFLSTLREHVHEVWYKCLKLQNYSICILFLDALYRKSVISDFLNRSLKIKLQFLYCVPGSSLYQQLQMYNVT